MEDELVGRLDFTVDDLHRLLEKWDTSQETGDLWRLLLYMIKSLETLREQIPEPVKEP